MANRQQFLSVFINTCKISIHHGFPFLWHSLKMRNSIIQKPRFLEVPVQITQRHFFEAHRNFALTYNANKTSIVLYRTTSLDNLSLRFRFASSCLSVIPQLRWVTSGEWFRALSFSGFAMLFDSLRAYCGKEIMYNFGFTPHRTLPVVATNTGLSITWHLLLFGDISFHPI